MWISDSWQDFEVLDCSRGEKLERWGKYTLVRPDPMVQSGKQTGKFSSTA